jgi:hypothetical protein
LETLLESVDALDVPASGLLIWVDDAHEHLRRGLTTTTLDSLVQAFPGAVVAMTMHRHELDRLKRGVGEGVLDASAAKGTGIDERDQELYERLERSSRGLSLEVELTATELPEAERVYGPVLSKAHSGLVARLANALAAVDIQLDRYRSALDNPDLVVGSLLVTAALVWRHGGMPPDISESVLEEFTGRFMLHSLDPPRALDQGQWHDGFTWARSVHEGSALLIPESSRSDPRAMASLRRIEQRGRTSPRVVGVGLPSRPPNV